jgi:hypothetical protein
LPEAKDDRTFPYLLNNGIPDTSKGILSDNRLLIPFFMTFKKSTYLLKFTAIISLSVIDLCIFSSVSFTEVKSVPQGDETIISDTLINQVKNIAFFLFMPLSQTNLTFCLI